ncbi:unnamed protein product [Ambrosiozyma monospora]|uniref:Unnamed protein product n=1 Tax=Ambrosiozyma monospora TaxID=43982 RepID=A0ACB5T443_AMBMO|nr:unnamed protein product [Ambrosiozyma monospora]
MKTVKQVSTFYSFLYLNVKDDNGEIFADPERISELEPTEDDWKNLQSFLFDKDSLLRLRSNEQDLLGFKLGKNEINFNVLIQLTMDALKDFGFEEDEILEKSTSLDYIFTLAKESYIWLGRTNPKEQKDLTNNKYYKRYLKLNAKKLEARQLLSELVDQAKKLYLEKKINDAHNKLESAPKSFKATKSWKEVNGKVEEILNQHRRRQQQQQQKERQRQYEQQRRQQQQQQQQQRQQRADPKKDYYKILGVSKDATQPEIKKAFLKQMRENHPDKLRKNSKLTQEQIEDKVAEINAANEVLSDPEKRAEYDRYGTDPNDPMAGQRQQQYQQQANGFPGGFPEDFLRNMFGGGGGGGGNQHFQFKYGSFQNGGGQQQQRAGRQRGARKRRGRS